MADRPALAAPPVELVQQAPAPVPLPPGPMTRATVKRLWGADIAALVLSRSRHRALADWYAARDAALMAPPAGAGAPLSLPLR